MKFNFFKKLFKKKSYSDADLEQIITNTSVDLKSRLKYTFLETIITNTAAIEAAEDVNIWFKQRDINFTIDTSEIGKIVESCIKYRIIKEILSLNSSGLSQQEASTLIATISKDIGMKLESYNNTTTNLFLGKNYTENVDLVRSLLKELDTAAKSFESGAYTETSD